MLLGALFFGQRLDWRKLVGIAVVIGAVGAAVLGLVFFDETLTVAKACWLIVIIPGVVWLKIADRPASSEPTIDRR